MEQFLVPAGEGASEYMEKKSRFLGLITPVPVRSVQRLPAESSRRAAANAASSGSGRRTVMAISAL